MHANMPSSFTYVHICTTRRERCICCVARTIRTLPVRLSGSARRSSCFSRNRYVLRYHHGTDVPVRARLSSTGTTPSLSAVVVGSHPFGSSKLEALYACISQWECLSVFRDLDSRPCALDPSMVDPAPVPRAGRGDLTGFPLCRPHIIGRPIPGTAAWNLDCVWALGNGTIPIMRSRSPL